MSEIITMVLTTRATLVRELDTAQAEVRRLVAIESTPVTEMAIAVQRRDEALQDLTRYDLQVVVGEAQLELSRYKGKGLSGYDVDEHGRTQPELEKALADAEKALAEFDRKNTVNP